MRRGERGGSVSLLLLMSLTAFLAIVGLVVDGAAKTSAAADAEAAAGAAARAGVNAAAPSQVSGMGPDTEAATRAARDYLAAAGVEGTVTLLPGGSIRVTTSQTRPTTFLSIVGIHQVTGRGQAEASLIQTGDQP